MLTKLTDENRLCEGLNPLLTVSADKIMLITAHSSVTDKHKLFNPVMYILSGKKLLTFFY